jgi:hypothetical protein
LRPPQKARLFRVDQLDSAGQTILQLLNKAANVAEQNSKHAIDMAQKLAHELRAAQQRISELTGSEERVKLLLERLAARHLNDDEITDATFGKRKDLDIHTDKRLGEPLTLMTIGSDQHYVATMETMRSVSRRR